jgi:hypothetical protein
MLLTPLVVVAILDLAVVVGTIAVGDVVRHVQLVIALPVSSATSMVIVFLTAGIVLMKISILRLLLLLPSQIPLNLRIRILNLKLALQIWLPLLRIWLFPNLGFLTLELRIILLLVLTI